MTRTISIAIANYGPILIISVIVNFFGIALKNRLIKSLEINNLLNVGQFGHLAGKSNVTAICNIVRNILDTFDNKNSCPAKFYYMLKAFHTICHDTPVDKLEYHGIRG